MDIDVVVMLAMLDDHNNVSIFSFAVLLTGVALT